MANKHKYRRFTSYGYLRLYKIQPDGSSLQIGSFAGPDADKDADELEKRDRSGAHRHPFDKTPNGE